MIQNLLKYVICLNVFCLSFSLAAKGAANFSEQDIKKINDISGFNSYLKAQKEMGLKDARNRWGIQKFNSKKFKKSGWKQRAPMAVDLLERKSSFIGLTRSNLVEKLGRHDGFFFRDHVPAYIIEDELDGAKESWQIVFLLGTDQKVADIRIFQN